MSDQHEQKETIWPTFPVKPLSASQAPVYPLWSYLSSDTIKINWEKVGTGEPIIEMPEWVKKLPPEELAQGKEQTRQYLESKPIWERKPNFYGSALDGLPFRHSFDNHETFITGLT